MIESRTMTRMEQAQMPDTYVHDSELLEREAKVALELLTTLADSMWLPTGKTTKGGEPDFAQATPEAKVEHAFSIAKLAMAKIREDGLMHDLGPMPEAVARKVTEASVLKEVPAH